jgi:hypothetical protein
VPAIDVNSEARRAEGLVMTFENFTGAESASKIARTFYEIGVLA